MLVIKIFVYKITTLILRVYKGYFGIMKWVVQIMDLNNIMINNSENCIT